MPAPIRILAVFLSAMFVAAGCADDAADDEYVDRMAEEHQNDTTEGNIDAMEPLMPVTGGPVTYGDFRGYEAYPERADSVLQAYGLPSDGGLPGVILIHEWWGLNDNMRAMADQVAGLGFRVLAVDLFDGTVAEDPDRAQGLMRQAMQDRERAMEHIAAAHTRLSEHTNAPRVGIMGLCFGGAMALNGALTIPEDLDALVIYYGQLNTSRRTLDRLDMPVLGIFGAEDESIPVDQVREFEETLSDLDKEAQIQVFDGVGHAFANPTGDNYEPEAAGEAWELTSNFLQEHLYSGATAAPAGVAPE